MGIHTVRLSKDVVYTGLELRPLWCQSMTGLYGDILLSFEGPCDVPTQHLVDQEDALAGSCIRAARMLHFIAEHFSWSLREGVLAQRLLVAITAEVLCQTGNGLPLLRKGDDLFVNERKLSVSIATVSPVSALIHFALNIDATGSPVPAAELGDLGVAPEELAKAVLSRYADEITSIERARTKVRPVI